MGATIADGLAEGLIRNDDSECEELIIAYTVISTTEFYEACGLVTLGPDVILTPSADLTIRSQTGISVMDSVLIELGAILDMDAPIVAEPEFR